MELKREEVAALLEGIPRVSDMQGKSYYISQEELKRLTDARDQARKDKGKEPA